MNKMADAGEPHHEVIKVIETSDTYIPILALSINVAFVFIETL